MLHLATLMNLTRRCDEGAVTGLNEVLRAKTGGQKLPRTARTRADTAVICGNVAYPTDTGRLGKAVGKLVRAARRVQSGGEAPCTKRTDRWRGRCARSRPRYVAGRIGTGRTHAGDREVGSPGGEGRRAGGRSVAQAVAAPCPSAQWPGARPTAPRPSRVGGHHRAHQGDRGPARTRLAGQTPAARPAWSACTIPPRPIRKGRIGWPLEFG